MSPSLQPSIADSPLRVQRDKVVTLRYALFDNDTGDLIEYRDDLVYLHGGRQRAMPQLEQVIEGFEVKMKAELELTPEEAFGAYDPSLVVTEATEHFPEEAAQVGVELDAETADGVPHRFRVVRVEDGWITVDGNHPLAGKSLRFVVEVTGIRDATNQERAAGCVLRTCSPSPATTTHH